MAYAYIGLEFDQGMMNSIVQQLRGQGKKKYKSLAHHFVTYVMDKIWVKTPDMFRDFIRTNKGGFDKPSEINLLLRRYAGYSGNSSLIFSGKFISGKGRHGVLGTWRPKNTQVTFGVRKTFKTDRIPGANKTMHYWRVIKNLDDGCSYLITDRMIRFFHAVSDTEPRAKAWALWLTKRKGQTIDIKPMNIFIKFAKMSKGNYEKILKDSAEKWALDFTKIAKKNTKMKKIGG